MLIIGIIPFAILSTYLYVNTVSYNESDVLSDLTSASKTNADAISTSLSEKMKIISSISHSPYLISLTKNISNNTSNNDIFLTKMALSEKFFSDISSYDWIEEFSIIDTSTGKILYDTNLKTSPPDGLEKIDLEKSSYNVTSTDIFASNVPMKDNGNFKIGMPTMLISAPISSEVKTPYILSARVNVKILLSDVAQTNNLYDHEQQYLVNSQGYFLSIPKDIKINSNFVVPELHLKLVLPHSSEISQIFKNSSTQDTVSNLDGYVNYAGNTVVGAISPIKGMNSFFIVEIDKNDAFQKTRVAQQLILISLIILGALLAWLSDNFTKSLIKPLKKLQLAVSEISSGKYVQLESKTSDEMGKIYSQFNNMSKSLKATMDRLISAEQKYRTLYDNAPEMYRTVNAKGIILDCNDGYAHSLGYSKDEIIGKSIFEHTSDNSIVALQDSLSTWKNSGTVQNREIWMKRKDGTIFPVLVSANTLPHEGGDENMISNTVIKDISELHHTRTELEEQKIKRLSDIGELAGRIAHDLRNPLSIIKNSIDLMKLQNPNADEGTKKNFERLTRAIYRMTHQIDEVLDYVTPKPLNIEKNFSINQLIESTFDRLTFPEDVKIHYIENSIKINCDILKMEIVLVNLILNAMQAMNNKGEIFVRALETGDLVYIEVEDTGPGIPENVLPKIFDPLFTTRQIGTGLGLPSCKNIVEKHLGTISVKTKVGKGTTFIIKLPKNVENNPS
jgi:PAS domain S-box-containing protein